MALSGRIILHCNLPGATLLRSQRYQELHRVYPDTKKEEYKRHMKDHNWEFILGSEEPKIYIQNLKNFIPAFLSLPATKAIIEEMGECLI